MVQQARKNSPSKLMCFSRNHGRISQNHMAAICAKTPMTSIDTAAVRIQPGIGVGPVGTRWKLLDPIHRAQAYSATPKVRAPKPAHQSTGFDFASTGA